MDTAMFECSENSVSTEFGTFDAAPCRNATVSDLDHLKVTKFIRTVRDARKVPLPDNASVLESLEYLRLLVHGIPTNAAVLLFGKDPQRFLVSSGIRCSRYHGFHISRPVPAYRVCTGTISESVDSAVDFVLGKIDRSIGTREHSVRAPRSYEIPAEVIFEAIVNAVAHRDYTSNGSVQVMLFKDRLEIWNPGRLPMNLTVGQLCVAHDSVPRNPLLAESLFLSRFIERMGTGTIDMINRCLKAGLQEPEFSVGDGFTVTIKRRVSSDTWASSEDFGKTAPQVAPQDAPQVAPQVAPPSRPRSRQNAFNDKRRNESSTNSRKTQTEGCKAF